MIAPQPLATTPPRFMFLTFAAFVLGTTVFFDFFFLRAVAARSDLLKDSAFDLGRHLSGLFLFFEVPQGPLIEPSVPILTQF
jgi:hypothetical protein